MYGEVRNGCLFCLGMSALVWALVLVSAWFLVGCTATGLKAEAELSASRAGCLCAGVRCGVLISGSGQAAVGAEAAGVLRSMVVDSTEVKPK